ncbi:MAG: 3-oxoadipate enol-lactonase [Pseudonocardiales bacterium]|jgi:3-oxoadipate enol-lactonase|nr:3-oxoadipate enol-lactonase [Pseudonocardiales bacterium]
MEKVRQRDSLIDLGAGYRARVQEDGRGPVLVLVHGTPLDTRAWDPLVPLLCERRRVVRYDARGHGTARSAPIPDSFSPLADDVAALLDELDVHRAQAVGHSWGGQIAQRFALDHPDRLSRLSLLCTRSTPFPAFHEAVANMRATGRVDPEPALHRWFSPAALAQPHGFVEQVRTWLQEAPLPAWAAALDLIADFDVLDDLPQVAVPVDVVCAELDQVSTPDHMTEIYEALPFGRWVLLQGARHLVPLEQPARVAEAILAH